jgi:hypothetical protein
MLRASTLKLLRLFLANLALVFLFSAQSLSCQGFAQGDVYALGGSCHVRVCLDWLFTISPGEHRVVPITVPVRDSLIFGVNDTLILGDSVEVRRILST